MEDKRVMNDQTPYLMLPLDHIIKLKNEKKKKNQSICVLIISIYHHHVLYLQFWFLQLSGFTWSGIINKYASYVVYNLCLCYYMNNTNVVTRRKWVKAIEFNFSGIRFCLMRLRYPSYMDPVARISVAGRHDDTLWTTLQFWIIQFLLFLL